MLNLKVLEALTLIQNLGVDLREFLTCIEERLPRFSDMGLNHNTLPRVEPIDLGSITSRAKCLRTDSMDKRDSDSMLQV